MSNDAVPTPSRGERLPWKSLLPWLDGLAPDGQQRLARLGLLGAWWTTRMPEHTFSIVPRDRLTRVLAEIVLDLFPSLALEKVLPHLPAQLPITRLPALPTRARNALSRMGARTVDDLADHSAATLVDLPKVGRLTVVELLAALIDVSVQGDLKEPSTAAPSQQSEADQAASDTTVAPELDPVSAQLLDDLATVARWRHLQADPSSPLLQGAIDESAPAQVQQAQERLAALSAADLLDGAPSADPIQELEDAFAGLPDRKLQILRRRLFAAQPATLEEIGRDLGVTRERTRQLEMQLKAELAPLTTFGAAAGDLLAVVRAELRPVVSLERLTGKYPLLDQVVPAAGAPLWLVLDRLDDAFEVRDGWAAAPTVAAAVDRTRRLLEDLDDRHGLVPLGQAADSLGAGLTAPEDTEWFTHCGYDLRDGHVLTRTRSIPDRAAAVLSLAGQPLVVQEILNRLGTEPTVNSCRNALGADPRFTRVDRDRWALAEWGLERYTSIRDVIGRALDAAGGEIALAELAETLEHEYSVARTSIQAYASAAPYEVRGGMVRRQLLTRRPSKNPCDTRRLFRHQGGWRYRLAITRDHLRGSGFSVPAGLAGLVGCTPRTTLSLESRLGAQPVRWTGLQPSVGTIRRFLEDLAVSEGTVVFLWIGDDQRFDVQSGIDPDQFSDPLVRALALVGVTDPAHTGDLLGALAGAVCLPRDADAVTVLGAYTGRGEQDIVELLEARWDHLQELSAQRTPPKPPHPVETKITDDIMNLLEL